MLALLLSLLAGLGVAGIASSSGGSKVVAATSPSNDNTDVLAHTDTHSDDGHTGTHGDDGHTDTHSDDGHTGTHGDDGHTGTHGDDGHTGTHGDGHMVDLPVTPQEIAAFVEMVRTGSEVHIHDAGSSLMSEHMALLDLVPPSEATHIAIGHGSWFDPDNWHNGEVPGDNAKVVIPKGVEMTYDDLSDERLFTLRVDGELSFATDADSKIVIDTFVVSPTGTLTIGTEENPVAPDVDVEIVIANNGEIDTNWDPNLLSRGIISHGKAEIHGATKDSHEKVIEDPMAGDTSVTFSEAPEGWQVGDKIIIAGTHYDGYKWDGTKVSHHEPEDEIRYISKIEGNEVFFDNPLVHDHDAPRADLHTSVANYSRNVSISTEDPDTAEIFERGHAMFMHSDDVDIRYAAFEELGRTDKSESAFDASDFDNIAFDSNVKGRYGLHLHRLGTDDVDNPAIISGNAVYGSPGWGFVHHDSNAILNNNASYKTFGAGFVSESGNEIGAWIDNIAIFSQGIKWSVPKNAITTSELSEFDTGKSGDGFWFQSRLVAAEDNIAASVNNGFVYFHRGPKGEEGQTPFHSDNFLFPDAFHYSTEVGVGAAPILEFSNNEAFAAREGLHIVKSSPNQGHDIHSVLDGFTAWSVKSGAHLEYTSHYVLKDFDLIARASEKFSEPVSGVTFGTNTTDMILIDSSVHGFSTGLNLAKNFTDNLKVEPGQLHEFVIVDTDVTGSLNEQYRDYDPTQDTILDTAPTTNTTPSVEFDNPLIFVNGPSTGFTQLELIGTKTDGLGSTKFPTGTDNFEIDFFEMQRILKTDGFHTADDGNNYFMFDLYFSDRLNGDIYKQTELVQFDENVPANWFTSDVVIDNGLIDLTDLQAMATGEPVLVASPIDPNFSSSVSSQNAMQHSQHAHAAAPADDVSEMWDALTRNVDSISETAAAPSEEDAHDALDML